LKMHLDNHQLRILYDRAASPELLAEYERHTAACEACTARLAGLAAQTQWVSEAVNAAPPQPIKTDSAWNTFEARIHEEKNTMQARKPGWNLRPVFLTLVALGILSLFAVPSVRAAAVEFLGLFRVQQIEVVEFNPANLPADLEGRMDGFQQVVLDQLSVSEVPDPVVVSDAAEASEKVGFSVRLPELEASLPQTLTYQGGATATSIIDIALWQSLFDGLELADVALPASIDGETVTMTLPGSVTLLAGPCEVDMESMEQHRQPAGLNPCTVFVQMESPVFEGPAELPVAELGTAFLQFFGLTAEEAAEVSERMDWTTTLILPVPQDADYEEVNVDGVVGTLFTNDEYRETSYSLFWIKDGILYVLSGYGDRAEILALANSLR
jgi:hypothetical protein